MRFFIDNNLPPALAKALHALSEKHDHEVYHLTDLFDRAALDHDWISSLARQKDWVLITQDRFSKNDLEKKVFRDSKLTAFFLKKGWSDFSYWEKAWLLVRWWPNIVELAGRVEPGATFYVPVKYSGKGKLEQFNY